MRVKSISVKGLFGVFDHSIPLQSAERVTIIHGPNGFGKTVMLRMIAALVEGSVFVFEHTPFSEFRLTFEDETAIIVRRDVATAREGGKPEAKLQYLVCDEKGNAVAAPDVQIEHLPRSVLQKVDKLVSGPYTLHGAIWQDSAGHEYSLPEILERFPRARTALPRKYRSGPFAKAQDEIQVFFVRANRLDAETPSGERLAGSERYVQFASRVGREDVWLSTPDEDGPNRPLPPRVKQHSTDVVRRIQSVLADYAKYSQERDRTFPERLVRFVQDGQRALLAGEITTRMSELEKKRQRLISLGLLDSESGLRNLSEDDVRRAPEALTIYLGDMQEKLKVFDDIADRIERPHGHRQRPV